MQHLRPLLPVRGLVPRVWVRGNVDPASQPRANVPRNPDGELRIAQRLRLNGTSGH
jgi:hypothetical protein